MERKHLDDIHVRIRDPGGNDVYEPEKFRSEWVQQLATERIASTSPDSIAADEQRPSPTTAVPHNDPGGNTKPTIAATVASLSPTSAAKKTPTMTDEQENLRRNSAIIHEEAEDNDTEDHARRTHTRPTTTILDLHSDTATSSALPVPFGFAISRKGHLIVIFGSTNIWLVNTERLPRAFMRVLQTKRKPVAVDVLDNGSLLAVLSNANTVDIYNLHGPTGGAVEKRRTIFLEHDSNTLALSPCGLVLATGFQFGIELISIAPTAVESDRRVISCEAMDTLCFADDGRTLLATTLAKHAKSSTIFTVHDEFNGPLNEEGLPEAQPVETAWTRQILFPEKASNAGHATLIPVSSTGQINELFAFDSDGGSWGMYDLAERLFTERKSLMPEGQSASIEDAMPALSPKMDHVAIAVKHADATIIRLYRLPDTFDHTLGGWAYTDVSKHPEDQSPLIPCVDTQIHKDSESGSQEISALRWFGVPGKPHLERLIAVGNAISTTTSDGPVSSITQGSNGIIVVMDYDWSRPSYQDVMDKPDPAPNRMMFDLDSLLPGERLPEESLEFEREVELVRTRTVAQRVAADRAAARSTSSRALGRSMTTGTRDHGPSVPAIPVSRLSAASVSSDDETMDAEDARVVFDEPYDNSQPRSQASLHRAATVAASSPAVRRHLRALPSRPLEYRRADGLREFPHESDADDWVPPPPPYTPNADPPGPGALSISLTFPQPQPVLARSPSLSGAAVPSPNILAPSPQAASVHPQDTSLGFSSRPASDNVAGSSPPAPMVPPLPGFLNPSMTFPPGQNGPISPPSATVLPRRPFMAGSTGSLHMNRTIPPGPAQLNEAPYRRPTVRSPYALGSTRMVASVESIPMASQPNPSQSNNDAGVSRFSSRPSLRLSILPQSLGSNRLAGRSQTRVDQSFSAPPVASREWGSAYQEDRAARTPAQKPFRCIVM